MKNKTLFFLLGIFFFLALAVRFIHLDQIPVGFHVDEASLGYNAYSLLLTGRDDNGQFLPLYIDMFGDQRPSGYHFLTIVPVFVFGLNEFATRTPAAFFGALTILAVFFVSYILTKNKIVGLLSSIFLVFAPWNVILSRASGEAIVALFFILTGLAVHILGMRRKSTRLIFLSTFFYATSFFFYHTPRVFVSLLLVCIFLWSLYYRRELTKKIVVNNFTAALFVGFIALSLVFLVTGGTGRFNQVNIFSHPETQLILEEQIQEDGVIGTPLFETRIIHNKLINFSLTFLENYFEYFTGQFLFMKGGLPNWYIVPNVGLLFIVLLPGIIYGLYLLGTNKDPYSKIPILWILIAPVTASITVDDIPNINRAIVLFPMLEIVAALGVYGFITRYKKKNVRLAVAGILVLLFLCNVMYFMHQYFTHTQTHRTWYRNNGTKEMMQIVNQKYHDYDTIVVTKATGGIYPLILFYSKFDPALYQKLGSTKDQEYTQFGKFFFVPQGCPSKDKDKRFPTGEKSLYINVGECPDMKYKVFKDIYKQDGTKAFRLEL